MYSYFASNVSEVALALNNMDMYEPWQQEFICSEANRYAINFFGRAAACWYIVGPGDSQTDQIFAFRKPKKDYRLKLNRR